MPRPAVERFMAKVDKTEGCWLWTGSKIPAGYGQFKARSYVTVMAHRWAYEFFVAPIPPGLTIDHLCRVRNCVNPEHLEPVTGPENTRRATLARTACSAGHEFTAENTWHGTNAEGHAIRKCRTCNRDRKREARAAA